MLKSELKHTPQASPKLFPQERYISDLEALRNKYALRLQKGLAEHIIKHKQARAIYLFLELKPLFSSGVIFSDSGKIPYQKIADFTGEGLSTIRKKITVLKKMRLLSIDHKKNICLASITKLPRILKVTKEKDKYRKKYALLNNGQTQFTVKQIALYENLKRQEHQLFLKIYFKELLEIYSQRETLDKKNSKGYSPKNLQACEQCFAKSFLKKFRKYIRDNFDTLKRKYQNIYDRQVLQLQFGFPELNPYISLSYKGIGKILGISQSTAVYQVKKLASKGLIDVTGNYCNISEKSPAVYESMCGIRQDIFSYVYPTRKTLNGKHRLYYRNKPNSINPLVNATFF